MELLQQKQMDSPVKRRLFGLAPPEITEELLRARKQAEMDDASRFKRKWNFDVYTDKFVDGEYSWSRVSAGSQKPIPEMYTKTYTQKSRRRALKPCVGRNLSFVDSDEENCDERVPSPVQYCHSDVSTMVFIGINSLPHQQSLFQPTTPQKLDDCCPKTMTVSLTTDTSGEVASVTNSPSSLLLRRLRQRRITGKYFSRITYLSSFKTKYSIVCVFAATSLCLLERTDQCLLVSQTHHRPF